MMMIMLLIFIRTAVQGHLYGSQVFDASTTTGNLQSVLEGEEEIEATPFAATVPKPLMSQFPDFITPSIYSYNAEDGTSEGFENSPRIMYNNGVKILTSCTYYIPELKMEYLKQIMKMVFYNLAI
jgi:hypothetical protein